MTAIDPVKARQFAIDVVRTLRGAGFQAFWAGGCVRDKLMGREPKDYDVATSALPDEIRSLFGLRRTLPIGASFGVITVLGARPCGQIDVATFRRDAAYSDGRHPDSVTFCSAEDDARRRDFTINGLFYDPLDDNVLDYVGGQEDLARCVIRAIGDPASRIAEDKLRMLRAVRFATTLGFEIDQETWGALRSFAPQIRVVSAERITEELRRMLAHPARPRAVELLRDARLLHEILPEADGILPRGEPAGELAAFAWDRTLRSLEYLDQPSFAVCCAALLREIYIAPGVAPERLASLSRRWRLSNSDVDVLLFCLQHESLVRAASSNPWPRLQRVLIDPRCGMLLTYCEAVARVVDGNTGEIDFCRDRLRLAPEQLNPVPLIGGEDLRAAEIPPGPIYRKLLEQARDLQLTGFLSTKEQALDWIRDQINPNCTP